MQCASAILSFVTSPVLPYFFTLSHKRHDFRGKKLFSIKSLGIQHAKRMRHIVICDLTGSTVFFPFISQKARFFFFGGGEC